MRQLAAALLALVLLTPPALAEEPSDQVSRVNEVLIGAMKEAKTLGYQGRYDKLAPVLSEAFDFRTMARISVGSHWNELSAAEKSQLVEGFARLSIATFADRFDGFSGERFEIQGEKPGPRETVLVDNKIVKNDGEAVAINYLLHKDGETWRIVDVYLDAKISELAMKRSEYTAVIDNQGFERLMSIIEDKLARIASAS
ncbi:MAG: ABC transporter substrate-binding protein [Kiloniellales bacterium]